MTQPDEWRTAMEGEFVDRVDIPDGFEYLDTATLSGLASVGQLDGYGFSNGNSVTDPSDGLLVYVDTRRLPEQFEVIALRPEGGQVASTTTHESADAARVASAYMREDFE
jgi:hypothetical protein